MEYATEEDITGAINIPTDLLNPDKAEIIINQSGKHAAKVLAGSFDSFSHGDAAVFLLNCKEHGVYTISLDAATTRSDFKLKVEINDTQTGRTEASKTLSISNTGDWQKYKTYTFDTEEMAIGTTRLTMTWLSSTGQYTGNVKNIAITLKQSSRITNPNAIFHTTHPAIYDLQGRKVSELKKGVYIRNGKKIIIR